MGDALPEVKFVLLNERAKLPAYATAGAAGMDLCAAVEHPVYIDPGSRKAIPTGLAMELPHGFEGQIRPRSGIAFTHGIGAVNAPGTIDEDYRGEMHALLINHGRDVFVVRSGDRIAQLIIAPVVRVRPVAVSADQLSVTERGANGLGSTGVR